MIAFVAAERREFEGLERHLEGRRKLQCAVRYAVAGSMNGRPVTLTANGPGPELAKAALDQLNVGEFQVMVSIGFCGGLSPELRPADIFVATSVNGSAVDVPNSTPRSMQGPLVSMERVVTRAEEKASLWKSGACVVEMEAAGVLERARESKVRFHCIRVVTDTAEESFGIDFNYVRDREGRFSRTKVLALAMRNPFKLIPELIELDRRCSSAALALGDFIADCKF